MATETKSNQPSYNWSIRWALVGGNAVPTSADIGLDFFSQINETSIHPYMFQGQDKFEEYQDKIVT